MTREREAARAAILAAGSFIGERFGTRPPGVSAKGRNDFVTSIDIESERMITERLSRECPGIGILAEESAAAFTAARAADRFWIVDPLDGTTNFIHGYPSVGVSIALMDRGELVLGVVYDPLRDELFEAERGGGASLNGKPISVSGASDLAASLLGTGFPYSMPRYLDLYLSTFRDLLGRSRDVRRAGAAVLDLCHVASGRLDGFWELNLKPWDVAAGSCIVMEAGGRVGDFFDGPGWLEAGNIVAASPGIFDGIVAVTTRRFADEPLEGLGFRMGK